jgi:hypothetical protein
MPRDLINGLFGKRIHQPIQSQDNTLSIAVILPKNIDNVEYFFIELLIKSIFLKSHNDHLEQPSKIIDQLLTLLSSILGLWRDDI